MSTINRFGSADSRIIEADFSREQLRDFAIRKEILWESEAALDEEVSAKEIEYITSLRANDPAVGYNRWPRFKDTGAAQPGRVRLPARSTRA
jgi:hypothetical protein